ncbi:sulfatase [Algibacter sp. 2305UL17-15]|uniref:sulfatase family protein n=1 Tax=Algibacter sp. 2305UL17-15 TaxID=3231268 RepID=UPI003459FD21
MSSKIVSFIISGVLLFSCEFKKEATAWNTSNKVRPNIIFLLCDDLRYDALGYMGNTIIKTPHIDHLADNGVRFNNAYVTTSICAVSRASILTGQYARKHDIWGFSKDLSQQQLANTYPVLLKDAGYTIGFIGKYGVGHNAPKDIFDFWAGFNGQGTYRQKTKEGKPIHLTSKMTHQAIAFLDKQKNNTAPFCLSISFKAPHVEGDPGYFLPDSQFDDLYKDDDVPIPSTASKTYFNYFPEAFTKNNVARNRWEDRFASPSMQQENIKKYYRLISGVDQAVGRIMDGLKKNGQDKNTVIIFTSDNGFYLGEYGFAGKWYGSEPSIKVPLVITDLRNKTQKSETRNQTVLNIDMGPTILGFAGAEIPKTMQGKDLFHLIKNSKTESRKEFFYEHLWQSSPSYYIPSTEGVVSGSKKYMKYFKDRDTTAVIFEELYDLEKDPSEKNNLIHNPEFTSLKDSMLKKYYRLKHKAE